MLEELLKKLPPINYFNYDHPHIILARYMHLELLIYSYEDSIYSKLVDINKNLFLTDIKDIFTFNFNNYKNIEVVLVHKGLFYNLTDEVYLYNIYMDNLTTMLYFYKKHSLTQYKILIDLIFIDQFKINLTIDKRFFKYYLLSILYNQRLVIITDLKNYSFSSVNSLLNLYKVAGWYEREVWDLYGIFFKDHYDLKQILTDYCFNTYPFKKNFPLVGYIEIRYNYIIKKIQYEPIKLTYNYRLFNFLTGWEWF